MPNNDQNKTTDTVIKELNESIFICESNPNKQRISIRARLIRYGSYDKLQG